MENMSDFLEGINKKSEEFVKDIEKLQSICNDLQKRKTEYEKKEKDLETDRIFLNTQINKLENDLFSSLKSLSNFQKDSTAQLLELFKQAKAEADYRAKAEAYQRGLAEAAQKVLDEAAERAKQEAEYRMKIKDLQKKAIEEAQRAQADAAKKIEEEFIKKVQKSTPNDTKSVDIDKLKEKK